jgi:metallophosphoesterase superfamily enzyme
MIKVINDTHLDVRRVGGTTEISRAALQEYTVEEFRKLLFSCSDADHVVILGDLYDRAKVEEWIFWQVYEMLVDFCDTNPSCKVLIVRGNHDSRSKDRQNMCSLELLIKLLAHRITPVFEKPYTFEDEGKTHRIIPHMFNQEEFDLELSRSNHHVDFLYLHANVDNPWANGDHSLNLSREQIKTLHDNGVTVICAHEHQARRPFQNVYVIGNQFPTSIADALGNSQKSLLVISEGKVSREVTWLAQGSFYDVPVEALDTVPTTAQFVRINGISTKAEFSKTVQTIDQFRKKSNAFVVSNAVAVINEDQSISAEEVTGINVIELLVAAIPEKFRGRVEICLTEGV